MNAMDPPCVRRGWKSMKVRERLAFLAGELAMRAEKGIGLGRPERHVPRGDIVWWSLSAEPRTVPWARGQVRERLVGWSRAELSDSVELLVSELVTNAIVHGAGRIGLRLIRGSATLRCEVADDGRDLPFVREAEDTDESGRGLLLVSHLAARWGSHHTERGKIVWFEILLDQNA